jgi:segregation and condensation protein A
MEPEFESILEAYPVKLDNFEGPLDLLIHLIKQHEVNIYDIPIALVTDQYLRYIDLMQELNLDVAGEFLVMAATLIHIKSRMLLPRPDPAQEEPPDGRVAAIAGEEYEPELEVDLFSLITAFKAVIERARQRPSIVLPREQISIDERIEQLLARLSETEACGFEELFDDVSARGHLIVTFLALLELIRLKLVRVHQTGPFGPIRVYKRARPADAPRPIGDVGP